MKTVFNIVLVLCAAALIYICYNSIMGPINFENAKKDREKAVIARLIDIRKAQQEYRSLHRGMYAPKLDTLIDFVKNQKLPFVMKMGMLTDKQLEDGLTEKKAMAIIEKAKKTGRYDEVKKWGLENFKRDTMWVAVLDTIYPKGFNADSMKYIPHGNGAQFEMNVKNDTAKSGAPVYLFEVKAPYETYLSGLDKQEIINGYSELVDCDEQEKRFIEQAELKANGDEEAMSIDTEYIRAMQYGMPPISGWGLGIDRFLQFLTNSDNIRDVVLYPLMKPRAAEESED